MTLTIRTLPQYFPQIFAQRVILSMIVLAMVCALAVMLYRRKQISKTQLVVAISLSAYVDLLFYFTVLGRYSSDIYQKEIYFIYSYQQLFEHFDRNSFFQILVNVGMLMPVGFFMPMLLRERKILWTLVTAMFITCSIEFMQIVMRCGTFEIDDILNNMLGAVIGLLLYQVVKKFFSKQT